MITVQLTNGFGNNIFQYAAARLLAEYHGQELSVLPPSPDYYAIQDLEQLGVSFGGKPTSTALLVGDQNYLQAYDSAYKNQNMCLQGYFEDYRYYYSFISKIKTWFPKPDFRTDNSLVIHIRCGDRLLQKKAFLNLLSADKYVSAIQQFEFNKLHIVTDMPKWAPITETEYRDMWFHNNHPGSEHASPKEAVAYYNRLVTALAPFNPERIPRRVGEDFEFIRKFQNILFEHGTMSWWASVLSNAQKVGVYGPWRPWKGLKNKNLSQIPMDGWFRWE